MSTERHLHSRRSKRTSTYRTWIAMRQRCELKTCDAYPWYGGKGVVVCERWQLFENFLADMGERPQGMTIDRIDSGKNYQLDNCRWARHVDQCRNRSSTILTWALAEEIRGRCEHGEPRKSVARRMGVTVATIFRVVHNQVWKHP